MSMGKLCDIFPNSRGPVHEYRFRLVRIIPDPECAEKHTEVVMFTATMDMGKRALDRAINGMKVVTSPPEKRVPYTDAISNSDDLPVASKTEALRT